MWKGGFTPKMGASSHAKERRFLCRKSSRRHAGNSPAHAGPWPEHSPGSATGESPRRRHGPTEPQHGRWVPDPTAPANRKSSFLCPCAGDAGWTKVRPALPAPGREERGRGGSPPKRGAPSSASALPHPRPPATIWPPGPHGMTLQPGIPVALGPVGWVPAVLLPPLPAWHNRRSPPGPQQPLPRARPLRTGR